MRIAVFSDSYLPYISGVVRSIQMLRQEAEKEGHRVYLFVPDYPGCQEEKGVYRFCSVSAPGQTDFRLAIPFSWRISATLRNLGVEVIHVHSPFLMGELGAYAARRLGLPLVFTYHTLYEEYAHYAPLPPRFSRWVTRYWVNRFCRKCQTVVVPTGMVAGMLRRSGVRTPVVVIPTGIEVEHFRRGRREYFRRRYHFDQEAKVLLFVGRLAPEKNLSTLLAIFREVVQEEPQARLVLVAGGPERERLEKMAQAFNLGEKVVFTGVLSAQDLADAYAGADVFVTASLTETQGLVLAEAKAAGLPVVAMAAGGVVDMVEDGKDGFLVPPHDRHTFQKRVLQLIRDEELRRVMGQQAWSKAEELSAQRCVQRLLQLYQELIQVKGDNVAALG